MIEFHHSSKMMANAAALALAAGFATAPAQAQTTMDASTLMGVCLVQDPEWVAFCAGYIQAANDQAEAAGLSCAAAGTNRSDLIDAFVSRTEFALTADPELGTHPALAMAVSAIADVYPCT